MGDSQTTPIGKLAINIENESDQQLRTYIQHLQEVQKQIIPFDGLARTITLYHANETYMYGTDIRTVGKESVMMYKVNPGLAKQIENEKYSYLKRVLNLCLKTDICQKLGMSIADFMGLEVPVFSYIEKMYYENKPAEQSALEDIAKELENTGKKK